MNKLKQNKVENLIYEIRGKQVMLDSDLALLYGCKNGTKVINQAVKRNIERFPDDFYFQLTVEEYKNLKSQFVTSSSKYGGVRKMPFVFTEQGIAQLSSVLKTENAYLISIDIMRAFVNQRHFIKNNYNVLDYTFTISSELEKHNRKLIEHDQKFEELFSKFKDNNFKELLYLDGQVFDAYVGLLNIMKQSKEELIIIDGYADISVLEMISKLSVNVIIIIKTKGKLSDREIDLYNKEYKNLKVIKNDSFHDRYLIIDKKTIYHCGSSINHAGNRTFNINKLEEKEIKETLFNKINVSISTSHN